MVESSADGSMIAPRKPVESMRDETSHTIAREGKEQICGLVGHMTNAGGLRYHGSLQSHKTSTLDFECSNE